MLVLTRKPGEQIVIGDNIVVTLVSIGNGRVKIGVEAPPTVEVNRQEVHQQKQAEKAAAQVGPSLPRTAAEPSEEAAALHNRIADKLMSASITDTVATSPGEASKGPASFAPRPNGTPCPRKPR